MRKILRTYHSRVAIGLLAVLVASLALGSDDGGFGDGRQFSIRNYRTQQLNEDGTLAWRLRGAKAVSNGTEIQVEGVQITLYRDDGPVQIFSSACTVDRVSRVASSSKKVRMVSSTLVASGDGFDFDVDRQVFRVRQNVTVRIFSSDVNLLGETGQGKK